VIWFRIYTGILIRDIKDLFMNSEELRGRTKQFALRMIKVAAALPQTSTGRVIENQMVKSGTSVGANYRATCRARSDAEFKSKLHIVLEEADESAFWLEIIIESNLIKASKIQPLLNEANELTAIFAKSFQTVKNNSK
jgi:four helix bundle protein